MPLRPLGLGDMYDAAFRIIRHNAGATVGSATLVAAVAMAIPVLVTLALAGVADLGSPFSRATTSGFGTTSVDLGASVGDVAATYAPLMVGSFLQWIGLVLVTGMVVHVTRAAALGRTMTMSQAWAETAGRRRRLVGLTVLVGLLPVLAFALVGTAVLVAALLAPTAVAVVLGIVLVPALLVGLVVWWVRFAYLAVPALMLEDIGVRAALGRAARLTRSQFWRVLGIALLTSLLTTIAASVLTFPLGIANFFVLGGLEGESALIAMVAMQGVSSIVSAAFVTPFSSAVVCLQYLDQRMRKEGHDVELISAAGLPGPWG